MEKERKHKKGQWATLDEVKEQIKLHDYDKEIAARIAQDEIHGKITQAIQHLPLEDLIELVKWCREYI